MSNETRTEQCRGYEIDAGGTVWETGHLEVAAKITTLPNGNKVLDCPRLQSNDKCVYGAPCFYISGSVRPKNP